MNRTHNDPDRPQDHLGKAFPFHTNFNPHHHPAPTTQARLYHTALATPQVRHSMTNVSKSLTYNFIFYNVEKQIY